MSDMNLYERYVHELCREFIMRQDHCFDCGCGSGFHTSILKQYTQSVIGGDLDNRTDDKYKIDFRKIEINKYGLPNEFDVVTSFDVIEHVEDDYGYLREIIKITRRSGTIIIGTPCRNRLSNKIISLVRGKIRYPYKLGYDYSSGGDIIHLREYAPQELIELASRFNEVKILDVKTAFLGLYTPWGPLGFTGIKQKLCKSYVQHLFIVLKKQ